jgi:hypothetical protein
MNKIKKAVASVGLALALASGAAAAGAPAANAYSDSSGYWSYDCAWKQRSYWVYRNYDWWEETFQWKRDGWVRTTVQYYNCYAY